jgi:hypothetical protein
MYYNRYHEQPTFWEGLLGGISQQMQKNQARREQEKMSEALTNINFDAPSDTRLNPAQIGQSLLTAGQQFNSAPQQYGIDQTGLISGKQPAQTMPFTPSLMPQQAPQPSLMQTNERPTVDPFKQALNASQSQPATVSPTVQQPREYTSTQQAMNDFQPQIKSHVKNLVKAGYTAQQAYQIAQQKAQETATNRVNETRTIQIGKLTDALNNAKDLRSATKIAMGIERLGGKIHPELIKAAWSDPNYDIQTVDYGGRKKIVAVNKANPKEVINLEDGEVTMTPYQEKQIAIGERNAASNEVRAANSGARPKEPKKLSPDKVDEYSARYDELMSDIWNSGTREERADKINKYTSALNAYGEALDIDVQNDIDYVLSQ